jgi:sortase A
LRIRSIVSGLVSAVLVGAGIALMASFFLSFFLYQTDSTATNSEDTERFNVPKIEGRQGSRADAVGGPKDKTLSLTIPKMSRIEDDTVPDATGDDENALRKNAAIHLKGTGFPWEEEANVYLAGHRLGYPGTDSFLAFYDLNKLEKGDEVFVEDAEGKKYTYRVFKELVVGPTEVWVTEPVEGKNVLTLQTCTLPDYKDRLIVQAELVEAA